MSQKEVKLGVITLLLFIASLTMYYFDHRKAVGIIEGSYFVTGLDVQKITKIEIQQSSDKLISLIKEGGVFLIGNHSLYPTHTSMVNNLLFNISNIKAYEKISSSNGDRETYEVSDKKFSWKVTFYGKEENQKVEFYVGKSYKNKGNYIRHADSDDIYLSDSPISYSTEAMRYVERKIFQFVMNDIQSVALEGKQPLSISYTPEDNKYAVKGLDKEKVDDAKVRKYLTSLGALRFSRFLTRDNFEITDLKFDYDIKIYLKNHINYVLSLASKKDKYYFKISANVDDVPSTIQVSSSADKEQLQNVENLILGKSKAQKFNLIHGSWVYELNKNQYENIITEAKSFTKP